MARFRSFDALRRRTDGDGDTFTEVRERRAGLKSALSDLEIALAAPAPGRTAEWAAGVRTATGVLQDVWTRHTAETEAGGAILEQLVEQAPRLANQVQKLRDEHRDIAARLASCDGALASAATDDDVDAVRTCLVGVLSALARHRQRGADLLYEAFAVDLGGGE